MLPALTRIAALALGVVCTTTFSPIVAIPNFSDLAIKTRETIGNNAIVRMNWYFKGPRQRVEQTEEAPPHRGAVTITQCDQGSYFILNEQKRTYLKRAVDETQMLSKNARKMLEGADDTVDVIITTDSVDTGERRSVGSYEARRVKTIVTVEGNEEAGVPSSKMETDGWYIDLPGFNCRGGSGDGHGMIMGSTGRRLPHYVFRQLGSARRGFGIEETTVSTQAGLASVHRTELLEVSESPLDPSLFEVPYGYQATTQWFER